METGYLSVLHPAEGYYEEKRSRFLAKLVPVHSEAEARTVIEQIRRELNDARHHVHAYRIKQDGLSRFSDDGEPHGTAGKPVFDVISGAGLTDVCLVVTRYFGGVLLGTGGLCHAYGAAAKDCMAHAQVVRFVRCQSLCVVCDYAFHSSLMALIEECGGSQGEVTFGEKVMVHFSLPRPKVEAFSLALTERSGGQLTAIPEGEAFAPVKS